MGWSGDPALVRLAYSTWFALDWASTAPGAVVFTTADENRASVKRVFGCEPEATIPGLVTLCEFALERAEEARQLMARLNLG
jgi:hypothetical protein